VEPLSGLNHLSQAIQQSVFPKNKNSAAKYPVILRDLAKIISVLLVPSVLLHCWLGGRKGIQPVKN